MKKNKGFTLIELMIVIAIIGMLVAIAVPNFIAYREKMRARQQKEQVTISAPADAPEPPKHRVTNEPKDRYGTQGRY